VKAAFGEMSLQIVFPLLSALIVFPARHHAQYVYLAFAITDECDETEFVSADIEDADCLAARYSRLIRLTERRAYIGERSPISPLRDPEPLAQRTHRFWPLLAKLPDGFPTDDPHEFQF
jgi:hypothetical protein